MRYVAILFLAAFLLGAVAAQAQWATVINAPPDPVPASIGSDTQVNIGDGVRIFSTLTVGAANGTSVDAEVNVNGGQLTSIYGYKGSVVNVNSGSVTGLQAFNGSRFNVNGGTVSSTVTVNAGGTLSYSGGKLSAGFSATTGATVNLSGGAIASATAHGAMVNLAGGSLRVLADQGSVVNVSGGQLQGEWWAPPLIKAKDATINLSAGSIGDYYRGSNTKLNVMGGAVGESVRLESGSVLTMSGGSLGQDLQISGSTVNLAGGQLGNGFLGNTATLNLSGGLLGNGQLNTKSVFNMTGGVADGGLELFETTATISGGSMGDRLDISRSSDPLTPSTLRLYGRDFRVDGVPLNVSPTLAYNIPGEAVLSGTLADGTPFAFTSLDSDSIETGVLTLVSTSTPAILPGTIRASAAAVLRGIRQGQTLLVDNTGVVGDHFGAGFGSTVVIEAGGQVGQDLEVVGASVAMSGGVVGDHADLFSGATMTLSGGQVGRELDVSKSTLNVTGGEIGDSLQNWNGGILNVSGGKIGNSAISHGTANISGGEIGDNFRAQGTTGITGGKIGDAFYAASSAIRIAGGTFGDGFETRYNAGVTVEGSDFKINGVDVAGLTTNGSTATVRVLGSDLLTCILADGTPLAIGSDKDNLQSYLLLKKVNLPAVSPAVITAPVDLIPLGIRGGQTLIVQSGGAVPNDFSASAATLEIKNGGVVGRNLELIESSAVISGGAVGDQLDLFPGSSLVMSDGSIGEWAEVHANATFTMSGGVVGDWFHAYAQSTTNVSGGHMGTVTIDQGAEANVTGGVIDGISVAGEARVSGGTLMRAGTNNGGRFALSGGLVGDGFAAKPQSVVTISGGRMGDKFNASDGSEVILSGGAVGDHFQSGGATTLIGGDFRLNGHPIEGLENAGDQQTIALPADFLLTGALADGTPVTFTSTDVDAFSTLDPGDQFTGTLTLVAADLPPRGPADLQSSTSGDLLGIRGQRLVVDSPLGVNFSAGRDSVVIVEAGGSIGKNFEAFDSEITIAGGSIDISMDAFGDSTVNLQNGDLGNGFEATGNVVFTQTGGSTGYMRANAGSTFNVSGGIDEQLEMKQGSALNLSGGELRYVTTDNGSHVRMTGGSISYFDSFTGGQFEISGGSLGDAFRLYSGTAFLLEGSDFRLDGVTIPGLEAPGSEQPVNIAAAKLFTGVLSDGTPFAISRSDGLTDIYSDVLRVRSAPVAPIGSSLIVASHDAVPRGIRAGQTVIVDAGGRIPANFSAGRGSAVEILAGGVAGSNLEGVGATLNISGGAVEGTLDGFEGSQIQISGNVSDSVGVWGGSTLRMDGGSIGSLHMDDHAVAEITGGTIGSNSFVINGSQLNISGGSIGFGTKLVDARLDLQGGMVNGDLTLLGKSVLNLSGGRLGYSTRLDGQGALNVLGSNFALDGVPLTLAPGATRYISDRGSALTGLLADGSPFTLWLNATNTALSDYIPWTANVTVTWQAMSGDFDGNGIVDGEDLLRWQRELGQAVAPGAVADGDRSGIVDAGDLLVWRDAFNARGLAATGDMSVPEPNVLALACWLVGAVRLRRVRASELPKTAQHFVWPIGASPAATCEPVPKLRSTSPCGECVVASKRCRVA
jgi:hypothetical protein